MKLEDTQLNCQMSFLKNLSEGFAEIPKESIGRRSKLIVRRLLSPGMERRYKKYINDLMNQFCSLTGKSTKPIAALPKNTSNNLRAGDWVRVRTIEEIVSLVNHWNQVKGCAFMPEMARFCGTTQRVFKLMDRFVDERDLLIKKSKGIILLEGAMCEGTPDFGRCDRGCFHFWREEWLEKIDGPVSSTPHISKEKFQTNQWVKVRTLKEIENTLDHASALKGSVFMPEMAKFCNTKQKVLKSMRRFVDERDLRVKMASGIFLLDGVLCHGKADFGSCDRSCFYIWREEWLEILKDST